MEPIEIYSQIQSLVKKDIDDKIVKYADEAKFTVAKTPAHKHTGVDSLKVEYIDIDGLFKLRVTSSPDYLPALGDNEVGTMFFDTTYNEVWVWRRNNTDTGNEWKALNWVGVGGSYVSLTGNENIDGVKTFTSFPVTPSSSPTTNYQVANKSYADMATYIIASSNLAMSADTENTYTNSSPVLKKEIRMNTFGTVTVKFSTIATVNGYNSVGQIYVNGVARGTIRTNSDFNVWNEYTETITIANGDLLQLYVYTGAGGTAKCKNFRLYYDLTKSVLSTVLTD